MSARPSDFQRVESIFHDALERPAGEREAFVELACSGDSDLRAHVMRLIRADEETGGALSGPALAPVSGGIGLSSAREEDLKGQRVGAYRLTRKLGEGGMGAVWLGQRDDAEFERLVAIKVIKRGMDTDQVLRRFRIERRALAALEHPSISRLIDAATTSDGRSALIMEYVEGLPLDTYCESNALTVRQRLELFLRVCDAVEHAHRQLVIHRDLKPSNIFVTPEGEPKLFDFGIAKLLSDDELAETMTATEQRVLTPRYASPEQIRGERVTTATDVFSLGVVLYELLTGQAPFDSTSGSQAELGRMICEQDPPRPSTMVTHASTRRASSAYDSHRAEHPARIDASRLRRELEGDLDTIVLMALRKEPERRYGSVSHLAEDIRRHLDDLPVRARPDTVVYRARKFVRRNRGAVVSASIILVLLVGGLSLMTWMYVRTKAAERSEFRLRGVAEDRLDEADSVASFLEDMLESATPDNAEGRDPQVLREILDAAARRMEQELGDQPRVRARIQHTLGSSYRLIGDFDEAERHLSDAERLRTLLYGEESEQLAVTLHEHALLWMDRGDTDRASELISRALPVFERAPEPTKKLANAYDLLGVIALEQARFEEAAKLLDEAIAIFMVTVPADDDALLQSYGKRAILFAQTGRNEEAIAIIEPVLERAFEASGTPSIARVSLMNTLAVLYRRTGRDEDALDLYDRIVETSNALLGPEHAKSLTPRSNRAVALQRLGRLDEAEAEFEAVHEIQTRILGEGNDATLSTLFNYAQLVVERGDLARAESMFARALELQTASRGPVHPEVAMTLGAWGDAIAKLGGPERRDEARTRFQSAIDMFNQTLGDRHPFTQATQRKLAALDADPPTEEESAEDAAEASGG